MIKKNNILIVGVGNWGKVITNFFIKNEWNVIYATKDGEPNIEFEGYFSSRNLSHFSFSNKYQFDLISICVRPSDILNVWDKYKYLSTKFLIEKPGANKLGELKKILNEACNDKKLIFINYEFNYSKTTKILKEKVINSLNDISSIDLIWEKPMNDQGGLEWRLLPHLLAELYFFNPINLTINKYIKNNQKLYIDGFFDEIPISIMINESKSLNHSTTINFKNGSILYKNREELLYDEHVIAKNSMSTLESVLQILNNSDKEIFMENNIISTKVINLINQIE